MIAPQLYYLRFTKGFRTLTDNRRSCRMDRTTQHLQKKIKNGLSTFEEVTTDSVECHQIVKNPEKTIGNFD